MSPIEKLKRAFASAAVAPSQRDRASRPRRRDLSEVAAEEYRHALRSVLRAHGDYRLRLIG